MGEGAKSAPEIDIEIPLSLLYKCRQANKRATKKLSTESFLDMHKSEMVKF